MLIYSDLWLPRTFYPFLIFFFFLTFYNFSFEPCEDHSFGFVGFWHVTHPSSLAWNVSRGIPHPSGQSSHSTQNSNFLFTHLMETLWLYRNKYTIKTCRETLILHGFKKKKKSSLFRKD